MGGGISIGPGPPKIKPGQTIGPLNNYWQNAINQFEQFAGQEPQLQQGQRNYGIANQLGTAASNSIKEYVNPVLARGGALTPQQERDVTQQTDTAFASRGMATGNQAITSEFLNRDAAKENRYNQALQQSGGAVQQQETLQQSALSQASTGANIFGSLANPMTSLLNNILGENLQAATTTQVANQNKGAGTVGGITSSITSILPAIFGLSDKRLKTKIKDLGEKTPEGIPIKSFEFKKDPKKRRFIGVIAQDVHKKAPHAVFHDPRTGMMRVNFSAIHAPYHLLSSEGGQGGGGGGRMAHAVQGSEHGGGGGGGGGGHGGATVWGGGPDSSYGNEPIGGIDIPPADYNPPSSLDLGPGPGNQSPFGNWGTNPPGYIFNPGNDSYVPPGSLNQSDAAAYRSGRRGSSGSDWNPALDIFGGDPNFTGYGPGGTGAPSNAISDVGIGNYFDLGSAVWSGGSGPLANWVRRY